MKIATLFIAVTLFAIDRYPDTITQSDLEFIKTFEKKAYLETVKDEFHFNTKLINFVTKYTILPKDGKLKVDLKANTGFKNYTGLENDNRSYYSVTINLTYPILDRKEENERQQKRMQTIKETIKIATDYIRTKTEIETLKKELHFLRIKDRRLKVRVHAGIQNLDDRVKLFEQILDIQAKIATKKAELLQLKELLIVRIVPEKREELRKML